MLTASRIVITRDLGLEDGREGENAKILVYFVYCFVTFFLKLGFVVVCWFCFLFLRDEVA